MTQSAIPLFSQYLRRLRAGHNDPSSDHELLQRFVTHREESAFTALVERHAAMVIGLCRSILRNHHDAEDIFQATFLVMARKAGSIRKGESVGSWLYVVAYRLAHKVRTRAEKRQSCEQRAVFHCEQTPMDAVMWGELRDILHQEISRLPEKYRAALVLCYWQGRTHEQAGQQLGCARGTIKDRLEKARDLLRKRLARRGLALSAAWFATSLSEGMGAVVSEELVQATVRGAMLFSMGRLPAGVVSAPVAACARAHVKQLFMNKLKYGLAFVLMLGVLCGGAGLAALHEAAPPETQPEQPKAIIHKEEQKHIDRQEEPLPAGAVARLGTLRFRHSDSITRIGIGTDGTSILSAAGNGVYVWDLATGKERRRFQHGSPVSSFACSADGRLLASGCQDGTIHVWDAATGQELRSFLAHKDKAPGWIGPTAVFVSGFTPDGRQIVSTGSDETLRLWDAASCEKIREFGKNGAVGSVTLSPDGKTLAGAVKNDQSCDLCLWEVATGRERKRRPQPGKQILASVFSPDGRMLAIAGGEKDSQKPCDIQLWDADAEKLIRTLRGHKGWAHCLFAPDGKTLVTIALSNRDGPARLWDVSTGREIGRIGDSNSVFTQLFFCPDGRTMASYTQSYHTFHFWDRASGKEVNSRGDPITPIDFLSFSPDGRLLATGSTVRWVIRLWDVAAGKTIRRMDDGLLSALQFSPDGSRLASAAWTDAQVRIWQTDSGKEVRRIPSKENDKRILRMAWSGDGKVLATWAWDPKDSRIHMWDPDAGKHLRELNVGGNRVDSLVFSPDSRILAVLAMKKLGVTGPDHVLLWEVNTGHLLRSLELPAEPPYLNSDARTRLAFSPDGRTLVAGGQRAEASIYGWELTTGGLRFRLKHGEDVACLAYSPDSRFLAAANAYNGFRNNTLGIEHFGLRPPLPHVHLWDLAAEKEIQILKGHRGPISTLAFSPDGKLLASGSYDTTVLLWDTTRFKTKSPAEVQLRPEHLESLWAELGGADAAKAYRAIRILAASPKASVAFVKQRLHAVAPADAKLVARLIADLDSDQFVVRDKAMQELEKLGDRAATELRKALDRNPPLEVKRRIEQLLDKQDSAEHIRVVRALETLERIGTSEARELCVRLADGVPDAAMTREARATLKRMTR